MPSDLLLSGGRTKPATPTPDLDASNEELRTDLAPPFRARLETPAIDVAIDAVSFFQRGERIGDFEFIEPLGEGSFGRVFLARQLSLDRHVAVKVTALHGGEARILACLEHDHIVHVFSELVDEERGLRLLCMQFVPGTTLDRIIKSLAEQDRSSWSGQAILEIVDRLSRHPAPFHPAALRDRELLADADFPEAVCWIGARLAEALDYAHSQGILHCDIKPANILVSQYGRPLLADFNLSRGTDPLRKLENCPEMFGGTLAYMAPEQLDMFDPGRGSDAETSVTSPADHRADLYSLGLVLCELLSGKRPTASAPASGSVGALVRALADARRACPRSMLDGITQTPAALVRIIGHCLEPGLEARYQSGGELAQALDGCREQRRVACELPSPGPIARAALRHPFLWIVLFAVVPHILSSVVNITYNTLQIVNDLNRAQQTAFFRLVVGYNALVYPICLWWLYRLVMPGFRSSRELRICGARRSDSKFRSKAELPTGSADVNSVRRQMLTWPMWAVGLSCAGWLPGAIAFPLGIHYLAGPIPADVYFHFAVSFAVCGMIALTYSYFGIQFVVVRVLYPQHWIDAQHLRQTAREELAKIRPRLRLFQILAGAIPLTAAAMLVQVGVESNSNAIFRLLVIALVAPTLAGFILTTAANDVLTQTLAVLTGTDKRSQPLSCR
jgi:serine/threonine protein kinase